MHLTLTFVTVACLFAGITAAPAEEVTAKSAGKGSEGKTFFGLNIDKHFSVGGGVGGGSGCGTSACHGNGGANYQTHIVTPVQPVQTVVTQTVTKPVIVSGGSASYGQAGFGQGGFVQTGFGQGGHGQSGSHIQINNVNAAQNIPQSQWQAHGQAINNNNQQFISQSNGYQPAYVPQHGGSNVVVHQQQQQFGSSRPQTNININNANVAQGHAGATHIVPAGGATYTQETITQTQTGNQIGGHGQYNGQYNDQYNGQYNDQYNGQYIGQHNGQYNGQHNGQFEAQYGNQFDAQYGNQHGAQFGGNYGTGSTTHYETIVQPAVTVSQPCKQQSGCGNGGSSGISFGKEVNAGISTPIGGVQFGKDFSFGTGGK